MKNTGTLLLILLACSVSFLTGLKVATQRQVAITQVGIDTNKVGVNAFRGIGRTVEPKRELLNQERIGHFMIIRSSLNGKTVAYSVSVEDADGYEKLSLIQLDSVMAGYCIK